MDELIILLHDALPAQIRVSLRKLKGHLILIATSFPEHQKFLSKKAAFKIEACIDKALEARAHEEHAMFQHSLVELQDIRRKIRSILGDPVDNRDQFKKPVMERMTASLRTGGSRLAKNVQTVRRFNKQTFGKELSQIPPFVGRLIESFYQADRIRTEGIFRLEGDKAQLDRWRTAIDEGHDSEIDFLAAPPKDCAALLRRYIADLPEPIIIPELKNFWLAGKAFLKKPQPLVHHLRHGIERLPQNNFEFLSMLLEFLAEVLAVQEHNKMNEKNLANIFAVPLLDPVMELKEGDQLGTELADSIELTKFMIVHQAALFQANPPEGAFHSAAKITKQVDTAEGCGLNEGELVTLLYRDDNTVTYYGYVTRVDQCFVFGLPLASGALEVLEMEALKEERMAAKPKKRQKQSMQSGGTLRRQKERKSTVSSSEEEDKEPTPEAKKEEEKLSPKEKHSPKDLKSHRFLRKKEKKGEAKKEGAESASSHTDSTTSNDEELPEF